MSQQVKLLTEIARGIKDLNKRINDLVEMQAKILESRQSATPKALKQEEPLDALTLLELPDHLRRTAMALHQLGRATAETVSDMTGNSRSIESAYLNQLQRQGYIHKERGKMDGENPKKVYFHV
ncbi:MAG: transcriptional regulator [Euryarchaeota archaeon]|nr:transcriptional regulator [Euryarchaeota archaeon]